MARTPARRVAFFLCTASILTACADGESPFAQRNGSEAEVAMAEAPGNASVKLIERDVEVPEVFQTNAMGLWDGRPSLGGVWVAHPGVKEPERVIIRNEENGKFVIGALFKRERENPGPQIQVSSDAAAALGMLAGAPDALNVTALRRQSVPIADETVAGATETLPAAETIQTASLDPIGAAGAALDKIENASAGTEIAQNLGADVATVTPASLSAPAKPAAAPKPNALAKPFIQVGLFSVQQNAKNTGASLRNVGIVPNILENTSNGKTYYRVTVGPFPSSADRSAVLKKVKGLGFADAYFVTN